MKKLAIFLVLCGMIVILGCGFFTPSILAAGPGDMNGDNNVNTADILYLLNYLFYGGAAPPNPIDADIDGSPGINLGDLLQLIGRIYTGCSLLPFTGASVRVGSEIRFSADPVFRMSSGTLDTTWIRIIKNGGPDLTGMVIPLSYANQSNEVEVVLDSVSFSGSITSSEWKRGYSKDNVDKKVLIFCFADMATDPTLDSGSTGLVATLYFTKVTDGDPFVVAPTEVSPSHSFMLMSSYCADGVSPSERIFSPMLSLSLNGDVNCDEIVDVGDVVYTINYLYKHGPPPCGM